MNTSNRKLNDEELSVLLSQHAAHGINWMNGAGGDGEDLCPAAAIEAVDPAPDWDIQYDWNVSSPYMYAFKKSRLKSASDRYNSFNPRTTEGLLKVLRLAGLV